jgi:two-component system, NtrC family, sensor kinase
MRQPASLLSKIRLGLAAKLAVCLVVSAAAIFIVLSFLQIRLHRTNSEELITTSAERLTHIIQRSTRYQMMRNDREALYQVIRDLGGEPGIRRIRIFNKEGQIRFSTDAGEVGHVVDKQAEACYACHAQGVPLTALRRRDHARSFTDSSGERVIALILPIRNEPSCSSAACHAHPPEKTVLGVIDSHLSLAAVDAQSARYQSLLAAFSGVAVLLLCGVSVAFIWGFVHRPIKDLMRGTHRVAGGDLDYRLAVQSRDELGELAISFNKMTAELAEANAEITKWTGTLEQRVEKKTKELEQAHAFLVGSEKMASLGKLAATVAHEVNNPLFGILTYARLCLKELESGNAEEKVRARISTNLQIIERESRRCGDIVKNLLTFARQAPRKRDWNDLNVIVERALTLTRHQMKLNAIETETQLTGGLPQVCCDAGQLQQVVLILVTNAIEATESGGRIKISTSTVADSARICVSDNGHGIAADVLPHVFEPFFTTKEDKLRTGLGLAVAKSIIEQHGGRIDVYSAPEKGTEFVVTLPLRIPAESDVSALSAAVGGGRSVGARPA